MNITQHIPASLILGSVLVASASPVWAEGQGVGSVELIPFPADVEYGGELTFSSDGSLHLLSSSHQRSKFVHQYRDHEWVLIRQDVTAPFGIRGVAVTTGATKIVLSNFERVDVVDGEVTRTLPRDWEYTDKHGRTRGVDGWVHGGQVSADGQVLTLSGEELDTYKGDSLIWTGENDLVNISDGLPRGIVSYGAGIPSANGRVIAFPSTFQGSHNNIRQFGSSDGDVWVWEDGQVVSIPDLQPGFDVLMRLEDIAGNGEVVIGSAEGVWRPFGAFNEPLNDQFFGLVRSEKMAWIWTRDGATQEVTDPRFVGMSLWSIDHDASIALGHGNLIDGSATRFLWFRDGRVLLLEDLFYALNIDIDVDWYSLTEISDDGTKLMGSAQVDGVRHAIIVTIPDLTP